MGQPGEHRPPLTPDEGKRAAELWARALNARLQAAVLWTRALNARLQAADLRDAAASARDRAADEREAKADRRDTDASARDRAADEREAKADRRDRELLTESATARLQARLETMPVIEQAKGMLMDQNGCTADQAFDLLRKASQRSNVPIRELAALIVARNTRRSGTPSDREPAG